MTRLRERNKLSSVGIGEDLFSFCFGSLYSSRGIIIYFFILPFTFFVSSYVEKLVGGVGMGIYYCI